MKGVELAGMVKMPTFTDHDSFRAWARSDECPEKLRVWWLDGLLWLDPHPGESIDHNQAKGAFCAALVPLEDRRDKGIFAMQGMLVSMPSVRLSALPDGMFVSYEALKTGRVNELPSPTHGGCIELEGPPEMVLEIVSEVTASRDLDILPDLYLRAGVRELWLVDTRGTLRFEILRNEPEGWRPSRQSECWWRSDVFGRDFLLRRETGTMGLPDYILDVR